MGIEAAHQVSEQGTQDGSAQNGGIEANPWGLGENGKGLVRGHVSKTLSLEMEGSRRQLEQRKDFP